MGKFLARISESWSGLYQRDGQIRERADGAHWALQTPSAIGHFELLNNWLIRNFLDDIKWGGLTDGY